MGWFTETFLDDWLGIDMPDPEQQRRQQEAALRQQQAVQAEIAKQTKAMNEANTLTRKAQDEALRAQKDAAAIAEAAAQPAIDKESTRLAEDDLRRKRNSGSSFGIGLPSKFGAPPVGFRVLSGQ